MVVLLSLLLADAEACSFASHAPYELDGDPADTEAPEAPGVGLPSITRGAGPTGLMVRSTTSCDDLGIIAADVDLPEEDLGLTFAVVGGELPDDFNLPSSPAYPIVDRLVWVWIDEATDNQEAFDFEVEVRAIDRSGNESEATLLHLVDGGRGCSSAPLAASWLFGLLLVRRHRC